MSSVTEVFVNQRSEIRRVGELAERFGADNQMSEEDIMSVNLVLDELVSNIIENAYEDAAEHQIEVTLALDGDALTLRVEDDGREFDPLLKPPPDLDLPLEERPVGGLGIHIVRTVMDDVQYERRDGRNILTMHKTIGRL
jgi:anti-sigma regulatory factor (Ser/Thr protein kinase)